MNNPWLKKNPFMSLWLSAAHKAAGATRAMVGAEAKRQFTAAVKKGAQASLEARPGAASAPPAHARSKARVPAKTGRR